MKPFTALQQNDAVILLAALTASALWAVLRAYKRSRTHACAGDGEHPSSGASHTSAKASGTYRKIRSNAISNHKKFGDLLRSHLRAEAPQYSRLIS